MKFKDVLNMRLSTLKRFVRQPHFEEHLVLHGLDCAASNGFTGAYDFVTEKLMELREEELAPPRLITGTDLIALGYEPGPSFHSALEAVENGQLEGQIETREQAIEVARLVLDRS
jgi:poly(A) polymerase